VTASLDVIKFREEGDRREEKLERAAKERQLNPSETLDLACIYAREGRDEEWRGLMRALVDSTNSPPDVRLTVARLCVNGRHWDMAEDALSRYLKEKPNDYEGWIEQAVTSFALNKTQAAIDALIRAVQAGGDAARTAMRNDQRLAPWWDAPFFRSVVTPRQRQFRQSPRRVTACRGHRRNHEERRFAP